MRTSWRAGRARFNAPDLKSDVGSNPPGVRIPRSPPYQKRNRYLNSGFFLPLNKIRFAYFYICNHLIRLNSYSLINQVIVYYCHT